MSADTDPPTQPASEPPPRGGAHADGNRFAAFLSYSRHADRDLAATLQHGLHTFAKPWYRARAIRVFRDDGTLGASSALTASIEQALAGSDYFVLLACPAAAHSEWVRREISSWRAEHPIAHFLIVLTDGDIVWDPASGDFDWERTTALPSILRGAFAEEPRYVDMRWTHESDVVSTRNPRFLEAVADLAAPMHGRPKDELIGADVAEHRRFRRLTRTAIAALTVLTVLTGVSAVTAFVQRNSAILERDTAISRELSAQAKEDLVDELPRSALLALEAMRIQPTAEARGALLTALRQTPGLIQDVETAPNPLVPAVAWSPKGDQLAWVETDGEIVLWDVEHSRRVGAPLPGLDQPAYALAYNPDGTALAASDNDGIVRIWDLTSPTRPVRELKGAPQNVSSLTFSPNGTLLAAAGAGHALLWSTSSWERVGPAIPGNTVSFSPDGRTLALGNGHDVLLWDIPTNRQTASAPAPSKDVRKVLFDPSGRTIATSSIDGLIVLWDPQPLRPRGAPLDGYREPRQGSANASDTDFPRPHLQLGDRDDHVIAFSHDGSTLASGGIDDSIVFWDVANRRDLGYYPTTRFERVYGIAFSPTDDRVATATARGDVLIWNNSDDGPRLGAAFHGTHSAEVNDVVVSRDGKTVVSGDSTGAILVQDVATRRLIGEPLQQPGGVVNLALSADGRVLAAQGKDVMIWDVAGHRTLATLHVPDRSRALALSPDGTTVATVDGSAVVLRDVGTRSEVRRLTGADSTVGELRYSADGSRLAAGTEKGEILVWDVRTDREPITLHDEEAFLSMALSPDGAVVATGGDGDVSLWDTTTRQRIAVMTGHDDVVSDLAFSPSGAELVSSGHDGAVFVWDVASRQRVGPALRGHRSSPKTGLPALIYGVDYGGTGTVVSVGTDGRVVSWDLDVADWTSWACKLAARNLSQAEWDRFLPGQDYHRTCADLPPGAGAPPG